MSNSVLQSYLPKLQACQKRLEGIATLKLFAEDSARASKFSVSAGPLFLDYSKNRIDSEALKILFEIAREAQLESKRDAMFSGVAINQTENRSVLHTALRADNEAEIFAGDENVIPLVLDELKRCLDFASQIRSGAYKPSGVPITDVVNIGIGGSDLGPVMTSEALRPYHDGPRTHFVSNVDGADFADAVTGLAPASTLVIVASKTFTTAETMANAGLAKSWLAKGKNCSNPDSHFAALSTNLKAVNAFGIPNERTFGFWDWVGGRYSIWSAIGLSLMIAIGEENFRAFLEGARQADKHFASAPLEENIPTILGVLSIWHRNVCGYETQAILPYENRLHRFSAYLQQLVMESNGKHVTSEGTRCDFDTSQIIWGEPGTNGQHAFYQMLHQGTSIVPCDFLVALKAHEGDQTQHRMLVANCFAQSEALMVGKNLDQVNKELADAGIPQSSAEQLAPHKVFEGNRPSNTIVYDLLTPQTLGYLIATYEHQVFVQAAIWDINAFDQWGVELGKQLANDILPELDSARTGEIDETAHDPSTTSLINLFRKNSN